MAISDDISLGDTLGVPSYLFSEHINIVDEAAEDVTSASSDVECPPSPEEQALSAVLQHHPLLNPSASHELCALLQDAEEGLALFEACALSPEARVHLLVEGRAQLVAFPLSGRPIELGQCRAGQWIGLANALRAHDDGAEESTRWSTSTVTIQAIPIGRARTRSVLVSELVAAMRKHPALLRYVRHHVAVRFARRAEILAHFKKNPMLRLLPPADQEYLLQLGALRRCDHPEFGALYLDAGKPSGRVGLLLAGECTTYLANEELSFVGKSSTSDLVGHEALVLPEELANERPSERTLLGVVEPRRTTRVFAAPGTEVLAFSWAAFRSVMALNGFAWQRLIRKLRLARNRWPLPEIVCVQAASPELGRSTLTEGVAHVLAKSTGGNVCIVDLHGAARFASYYSHRGFGARRQRTSLCPEKHAADEVDYVALVPPNPVHGVGWSANVEVVWPVEHASARDIERIVEQLLIRDDVPYVIVSLRNEEAADSTARSLARLLNARASTVLYLTDNPDQEYLFADVEPCGIAWVERLTDACIARENALMGREAGEARAESWKQLVPGLLGARSGDLAPLLENTPPPSIHRRRLVRVPNDPEGMRLFDLRGPTSVAESTTHLALTRAFGRLSRVITRKTVGLALGGGGAWGYAHIALIQNLEEQGVPIDYIAGSSIGSVLGALYAAGGLAALERMLSDHSVSAAPGLATALASFNMPLMQGFLLSVFSTAGIERSVDTQLSRMGLNGGRPISLRTTEIPFFPIGANLATQTEFTDLRATLGEGVRMSATMPPVARALRKNGQVVVDGGFVAVVPSRFLREMGADFIIASLCIPPTPTVTDASHPFRQWVEKLMGRFSDALWANQLLTWQAGESQAKLYADYCADLRAKNTDVFDLWKGREIVEQIRRDYFAGPNAGVIRDAWLGKKKRQLGQPLAQPLSMAP